MRLRPARHARPLPGVRPGGGKKLTRHITMTYDGMKPTLFQRLFTDNRPLLFLTSPFLSAHKNEIALGHQPLAMI